MKHKDLIKLLENCHLTGELNRNTPESNRQAIREFIAGNQYWTFGAKGIDFDNHEYRNIAKSMAKHLGMTLHRFQSNKPPYIKPERTAEGLVSLRRRLDLSAQRGDVVLFATNHPGSLLSFYQILADYVMQLGGKVARIQDPISAPEKRWLDDVNGVIALSDEGNLMHTHAANGFEVLLGKLKPDLVVADHAFAMGAINLEIPTVAFFDVDDPALVVAAELHPSRVEVIPMNDNQTNTRTAKAATFLVGLDR